MTIQRFGEWDFECIGQIEPERDCKRTILEFMPQERYKHADTTPLHNYGAGPFCRFRIGQKNKSAGLYVLTVEGKPVYAGQSVNVSNRWGPRGYGSVSPRNCFIGGQQTNCRLNAALLNEAKAG